MPGRVLIVEDEAAVAEAIAYALRREGFDTRLAADGQVGLAMARESAPDLVILDLMLPGLNGLDVCRLLRRDYAFPIIIVTARNEEVDRVTGLEVGADDYITKPFSMRELLARVRAVLRRQALSAARPVAPEFGDGHLTVNLERPSVEVKGRPVRLSPRELSLLRALLAHRGRARTRLQLLEEAWGSSDHYDPRTVDVHVRWLRKKLERDPENPVYIETVRGIGYRFRC